MVLYSVRQKIEQELESCKFQGVLLTSPGSVQYILGGGLPFLNAFLDWPVFLFLSKKSVPVCIAPSFMKKVLYDRGWYGSLSLYDHADVSSNGVYKKVTDRINNSLSSTDTLGLENDHFPVAGFDIISETLNCCLDDCSAWIDGQRIIKTTEEIERLGQASYKTDHGIAGAIHHISATNDVSEKYLSEDIRVHASERGCDVLGYQAVSQVASGSNNELIWAIPPKFCVGWDKRFEEGELIRCEMRGSYQGYFSDAGRILLKGNVPETTTEACKKAEILRDKVLELIKPGEKASSIYRKIVEYAESIDAKLYPGLGIGHGLGVSSCEMPFLNGSSNDELKENMVLAVDLVIGYGKDRWLRLKENVLVGAEGYKLLGRYLNWDYAYTAARTF